jgi:hypothetical protein
MKQSRETCINKAPGVENISRISAGRSFFQGREFLILRPFAHNEVNNDESGKILLSACFYIIYLDLIFASRRILGICIEQYSCINGTLSRWKENKYFDYL